MSPHASRPRQQPHRGLSALLAVVVLALAWTAACACLSALYTGASHDFARARSGASALAAGEIAVGLAPWRSEAHLRVADALALLGRLDEAEAAATERLLDAPMDGFAWLQRARMRGLRGRFDERTTTDYRMALARLPHSDPLNQLVALDAVMWWRFGDEPQRRIWLEATRHSLLSDHRRFLGQVVRQQRDTAFCAYAAQEFKALTRWCAGAAWVRAACESGKTNAEQTAWCRREGLLPGGSRAGT